MKDIKTYIYESDKFNKSYPFGNDIEEIDNFCNKITNLLKNYPYVVCKPFDHNNPDTIIFLDVSFLPKDQWPYNIFDNSPNYKFSFNNRNGQVENAGMGSLPLTNEFKKKFPYNSSVSMRYALGKMRSFNIKDSTEQDKAIKKVITFLSDMYKKYVEYIKELEKEEKNKL